MLLSFSLAMLLAGWRLSKRTEGIERRAGISLDLAKALEGVPIPIPVTAEGFALAILGVATGLTLALTGKWAERL